jgi:ribosomal protein L37AE/L43A
MPDAERAPQVPSRCPFCESSRITTNAKVEVATTYWRCEACGQLWHPGRLQRTSLPARSRWP